MSLLKKFRIFGPDGIAFWAHQALPKYQAHWDRAWGLSKKPDLPLQTYKY
jgi:hypothetical protein